MAPVAPGMGRQHLGRHDAQIDGDAAGDDGTPEAGEAAMASSPANSAADRIFKFFSDILLLL